jgi:hypothetical protein
MHLQRRPQKPGDQKNRAEHADAGDSVGTAMKDLGHVLRLSDALIYLYFAAPAKSIASDLILYGHAMRRS